MRFSAFAPGMVITAGPYAVSEAEVLQFAKAFDPQWFHTDPEAAQSGRFGGLIASGWHTCSIAMRLIADKARDLAQRGCSHIALAQFSMARARQACEAASGLPVMTTVDSAVRGLRARLASG